ncbi:PulJ/GspJ family protein [Alicyclobacillus suci]|uniref:PulJ/GspJ family protein n=1 Tax=Alicyclobacillus suci TaxID=2816080 RepID=UPI001CB7A324|nr:prepilin-type N-terminal cleavage/methylation domain-containing protein [Alicyclobacillus suci]
MGSHVKGRPCKSHRRRRTNQIRCLSPFANRGFSLIEVLVAMSISTMIVSAGVRLLVNTYLFYNRTAIDLEDSAMFGSCLRSLSQDTHAAAAASVSPHALTLTMLSGVQYMYDVNVNHQLIRIEAGGGDAVIAAHVQNVTFSRQSNVIHVSLELGDGQQEMFDARLTSGPAVS